MHGAVTGDPEWHEILGALTADPVGREYRVLSLTCRLQAPVLGHAVIRYSLAGEPAEDRSAANLVVDQVDHLWGLGFGLGRCELSKCPVGSADVEVLEADGQDVTQVLFIDDEDPVEQLPAQGVRSFVRRSRAPAALWADW